VNSVRRILILVTGGEAPEGSSAISETLVAQGAAVVVRRCEGDYDALLDDIAAADVVLCWRS
jgi:hypothetical protein